MVYIKIKKVGDKEYRYLAKSLRIPGGKITTIEKAIGKEKGSAEQLSLIHI